LKEELAKNNPQANIKIKGGDSKNNKKVNNYRGKFSK